MRYHDLLTEKQENLELISQLNFAVCNTINKFAEGLVDRWRVWAMQHRRGELGYHPTRDQAAGFKTFNQEEFDQANRDWSPDSDYIADRVSKELLPHPEGHQFHDIYGLMTDISATMTRLLQAHVKKVHGDPVWLESGVLERQVKDIKAVVWYKTRSDRKYLGVYIARDAQGGKPQTTLQVIIRRDEWFERLKTVIFGIISYDRRETEKFVEDIINTFMHEYAHFEQDIKGSKYDAGIIPYKGRRGDYPDYESSDLAMLLLLSRQAEIDAHAVGAAAERINSIIQDNTGRRGKFEITDPYDWNENVKYYLRHPPQGEFLKYVRGFDKRYVNLPKEIKAKFLDQVRKRFLKTYYKRLSAYLKDIEDKKLTGPVGSLPQE